MKITYRGMNGRLDRSFLRLMAIKRLFERGKIGWDRARQLLSDTWCKSNLERNMWLPAIEQDWRRQLPTSLWR